SQRGAVILAGVSVCRSQVPLTDAEGGLVTDRKKSTPREIAAPVGGRERRRHPRAGGTGLALSSFQREFREATCEAMTSNSVFNIEFRWGDGRIRHRPRIQRPPSPR